MEPYHIPVLLEQCIEYLNVKEGETYVDVTYGGGGHSRAILERVGKGKVIAFDQDPDALQNRVEDERLVFVPKNFSSLAQVFEAEKWPQFAGLIADLGISSHQIDTPERGFSYRFDAPLDMRMNPQQSLTAADLLNKAPEAELLRIFRVYGEIPNAAKLVRILGERREGELISGTLQFESMIRDCIPAHKRAKYLAQVYQALRIEVNQELQVLEELLKASLQWLQPGGRMVVMAYHSLEDRMVKRFFRSGNFAGKEVKDFYGNKISPWKMITRKAIQADEAEVARNSRARSARLRVAEKI